MRLCLLLDEVRVLRWHGWLIDALRPDHDVSVVAKEGAGPRMALPPAARLLLEFERLVFGLPAGGAFDSIGTAALGAPVFGCVKDAGRFDAVIDCSAHRCGPPPAEYVLTPQFNGIDCELGSLAA